MAIQENTPAWRVLIRGTLALALFTASTITVLADSPVRFGEILTGFNSKYHEQPAGKFKQDLSGAASDGKNIIFVDDGGSSKQDNFGFNFVRATSELPNSKAVNLPLQENHRDLEGATFHQGFFVVTTSLSSPKNPDQRRLTRFKIDTSGTQLAEQTSLDLRDSLMGALQKNFGDEWFNRIKDEAGKSGGLNIEGISRPHSGEDFILWGLRSPLLGDKFGNPKTTAGLSLSKGSAILAKVHNPFSDNPTFDFQTVTLSTESGDHGIRGIEWIPTLNGYVIIGGTIPAANDYSLWRLRPDGEVDRIELAGFDKLCRPESVIQTSENDKNYLVILSEESGGPCTKPPPPFTFIMAEILP